MAIPTLDLGTYMMPHFSYNLRPLRYGHFSYKDLRFGFDQGTCFGVT